jgi:hypothetical protein
MAKRSILLTGGCLLRRISEYGVFSRRDGALNRIRVARIEPLP